MAASFTGVGVSVTTIHRRTGSQTDLAFQICVELVTVEGWPRQRGAEDIVGQEKAWSGRSRSLFFFFLLLRPLRFPPVLTWLRLYNSPERVTSSRVKIPGLLFFSLSSSSTLSLFSFLLEGWGGGCSYCGTFVRLPFAEARPNGDLWQHLQDALVYAFNRATRRGCIGDWKERVRLGLMGFYGVRPVICTDGKSRERDLWPWDLRNFCGSNMNAASSGVFTTLVLILRSCDPLVNRRIPSEREDSLELDGKSKHRNNEWNSCLEVTQDKSQRICLSAAGKLGDSVRGTSHTEQWDHLIFFQICISALTTQI